VLFADVFIVSLSFLLGIFVMDKFSIIPENYLNLVSELPIIILAYMMVFEILGMYKSLWKYASIEELLRGLLSNFLAINISYLVVMFIKFADFNYAYYLVSFFLATTGTIGIRLSYRLLKFLHNYNADKSTKKRTLIVGAGQAGVMMLEEIMQNNEFGKYVVGFIDDNTSYVGKIIRGVPVLGTTDDICQIAYEENIDTIIIAIPSLKFEEMRLLLNKVEATGCHIKLMPPFYEMIGNKNELVNIRDVRIEDLLGREPIQLNNNGIHEYIKGKTVLVTGGGGSIGSELVRQLCEFEPKTIVIIDIYENNAYDLQMELKRKYALSNEFSPEIVVLIASVRERQKMEDIFSKYKPNVVFHAAAHKHVPLMEDSPEEAIKNNSVGTYNVAKTAIKYHVEKFVLISTDKAVRPTNVMGASKRIAEKIVMALNEKGETDFAAVRFGNVLGSNGSVIPLFKKQIESGGPVTVTHAKITRYFMTIPEACQLVIQAGAFAKGGELFVLDMGEPVKIINLAEKLIRLYGYIPYKTMDITFTGLRPGEKMYEELLIDTDTIERTANESIMLEKNNNGYAHILKNIEELIQHLDNFDAIEFIKNNVRSYHQ
jgi:FlaA1/EpsC-like NDP-sugar epimerase